MKKRIGFAVFLMVFVFLLCPMLIQAQVTSGTLRGYVVDENNGPIPGVTIEIISTAMMGRRSLVTDAKGAFRFLFIPPGKYNICAKLEGFQDCWMNGVPVQVAKTSTANIVMKIGVSETIEVTAAAPLIDTESSSKSYNVNIEMLRATPIAPRMNFSDIWHTLPGVATSASGEAYVNAGQAVNAEDNKNYFFPHHDTDDSSENKIMVDGMEINDAMSGKSYAQFNYEAIEEVDVNTAGASAEYGNARNAFMNIVTKSGGNEFQGSFLFQYQPMSFNTTNTEGGRANQISYMIPALTLSGPIMQDKLWFLASYKYDTQDYVFPDTIVVDRLVEKTRAHMPYLKLTLQPDPRHTISAVYQNDFTEIGPSAFPDSKRSTLDAGTTLKRGGPMGSVTWRWVMTDSLYFNFVAGWSHKPRDTYADTQLPRILYTSAFKGTSVRYDQGKGEDYWSVRENILFTTHLTHFADDLFKSGSHEIKFGVDIRPYHHITRTRRYWKDDFGFYQYKYGLDYESYGLSSPYVWEAREPFPGNLYDNEGVINMHDAFVQDNWMLSQNLAFHVGLRWEYQQQEMYYRDELPAWMDAIYPKMRENVEFEDSGLAPRLGLTYNVPEIGVFKLNFGKYFEYVGWNYHNYSTTIAFNTYRMDPADFGKGPEDLQIYSEGQLAYPADHNDIDNLKMDYHWETMLSYERELFWDMAFEATFLYRKHHVTHQEEINTVFENGEFVDRIFPDFNAIWRRTMYEGDERRTFFKYSSLQLNLKKNFTGNYGFMLNYSRFWRKFEKLQFDPLETHQYVYSQPGDLSMTNYGVRWACHASAFYRFPWDIMFSTYVMGQSGRWMNDKTGDYAWNDSSPRVFLSNGRKVADILWEAKNSYYAGKKWGEQGRYTDQLWQVNVRLQKGIKLSGIRLEASIDLFNVFNFATYQGWYTNDIRHPRYEEQLSPQAPRAAQLNFRIEF